MYRVAPQIAAFFYYHVSWLLYVIKPEWSYGLNADFEDHAEHEYMLMVRENPSMESEPFVSDFENDYGKFSSVADHCIHGDAAGTCGPPDLPLDRADDAVAGAPEYPRVSGHVTAQSGVGVQNDVRIVGLEVPGQDAIGPIQRLLTAAFDIGSAKNRKHQKESQYYLGQER